MGFLAACLGCAAQLSRLASLLLSGNGVLVEVPVCRLCGCLATTLNGGGLLHRRTFPDQGLSHSIFLLQHRLPLVYAPDGRFYWGGSRSCFQKMSFRIPRSIPDGWIAVPNGLLPLQCPIAACPRWALVFLFL